MPEIETILLICVVIASLLGGIFSNLSPAVVSLVTAVSYLGVAFFVFDREEPFWLVSLLTGFCMAGVIAMAGAFGGRALSKLLPKRD